MTLLDLAQTVGLNPQWVASTHGGEYHSPCPQCGGKDRFYMQPARLQKNCTGYYGCRQCEVRGDSIQFCMDFMGMTFTEAMQQLGIGPSSMTCSTPVLSQRRYTPMIVTRPSALWVSKANEFVTSAHQQLQRNPAVIKQLVQRGISHEVMKRYRIGYNPHDSVRGRDAWGLEIVYDAQGRIRNIWLPEGIVIPTSEHEGDVIRIKTRRCAWHEGDCLPKYVAVPGSMGGLSIIGNQERDTVIVVESELDAYALESCVSDRACSIAVGSCAKEPDSLTHYLALCAKTLLICHDNDAAGLQMFKKWHKRYAHARACPTPIGKDIGMAIEMGFDIREWIVNMC